MRISAPSTGRTVPLVADLSPPWVLFSDGGKPVAILPAGRPGEVANVEHLTMRQAREIVNLANAIHDKLWRAKLARLERELLTMAVQLVALPDALDGKDGDR